MKKLGVTPYHFVNADLYSRHTRHHMRNILISVDKIVGAQ